MKNKLSKLILLYGSFKPIFSVYENSDDTTHNLHEVDIQDRKKEDLEKLRTNFMSKENANNNLIDDQYDAESVFSDINEDNLDSIERVSNPNLTQKNLKNMYKTDESYNLADNISEVGETESNYSEFSNDNFSLELEENFNEEDSKTENDKDVNKVSLKDLNAENLAQVFLNDLVNNYYTDDWFQVAINFEAQNKLTLESINTSIAEIVKSKENVLKEDKDKFKQLNKGNNKTNQDLLNNYKEKLKSLDKNKDSLKHSIEETEKNLLGQLDLKEKEYDEFVKNQKKESKFLNSAQEKSRNMRMNDMKSVKQQQIKLEKTRVELINKNNMAEAKKFQVEERIKAYEGNSQVNGSLNNNNDKKKAKRTKSLAKFKKKLDLEQKKCKETKRQLEEFNKSYEQEKENLKLKLVELDTENANKGAQEVEELLNFKANQELTLKEKYLDLEQDKENTRNFYKTIIEDQNKDLQSISKLIKEERVKNPLTITKDYETSFKISINNQKEEIKQMQKLSNSFEAKKNKFVNNVKYEELNKEYVNLKTEFTQFVLNKWNAIGLKESNNAKREITLKSYKLMKANIDLLSFLYLEGIINKETYDEQINKSLEYNKNISYIVNRPYIKNKFNYIFEKVKNKIDKIEINLKNFFVLNVFKGHLSSNKKADKAKIINLDDKVMFNKLSNLDLSKVKIYKFLEKEIEAFRRFGINIPVEEDGTVFANVAINPAAYVDYLGIARNELTFTAQEIAKNQEVVNQNLSERREKLTREQIELMNINGRASSQLSDIASSRNSSRRTSVYSNIRHRSLNPSIMDENEYDNSYSQEANILNQEQKKQPLTKSVLNYVKINGGIDVYMKIYSNEKMRISSGARSSVDNLSLLLGGLLMLEYSKYIVKLNIEPIGIDFYGIYLGKNRWNPSININILMHFSQNLSLGGYFGYSRNAGFTFGLSTMFFSKKFIPEIKSLSKARNGITGSIGYKNKCISRKN